MTDDLLATGQQVQRVQQELTTALVQALERQRALRALAGLVLSSLEEDLGVPEVMRTLLTESLSLVGADGGAYVVGDHVDVVGSLPPEVDAVAALAGLPADPSGEGVALALGDRGSCTAPLASDAGGHRRGLVLARTHGKPFDTGELNLAETVAVAARLVDSVARLRGEAVARARADEELAAASALAQATLQLDVPAMSGARVFARTDPARAAGGDFFLCLVSDDVLWVVVGDVAGKGLPAALVMTKAVAASRLAIATCAGATRACDPVPVIAAIADELYCYLSTVELFVTEVVAALDTRTGRLVLTNAGHSPVLLATRDGVVAVPATAPPLGVVRGRHPQRYETVLAPDDLLLLGSDGLVEQEDADGRMLGQERLGERLLELRGRAPSDVGAAVLAMVESWGGGEPAGDDRTLVVVSRGESSSSSGLVLAPTTGEMRRLGPWLDLVLSGLPGAESAALRSRLELAVHEVGMNVVDHGRLAPGDVMEVTADVSSRSVVVTVVDPGVEVDVDGVPEPVAGVPQERGYGMVIVRKLVDELTYERLDGRNRWRLRVDRTEAEDDS